MIFRRRVTLVATALLLVALSLLVFFRSGQPDDQGQSQARSPEPLGSLETASEDTQVPIAAPPSDNAAADFTPQDETQQTDDEEGDNGEELDANEQENASHGVEHRELFSLTTRTRKFSIVWWSGQEAYNPNIIPHPTRHDVWLIVAQRRVSSGGEGTDEEVVCAASFINDALICEGDPTVLPVAPVIHPGICEGDLEFFDGHSGPKDARMFYGPDGPLVIYGSQSAHTCFGLWLHDARMLLDSFTVERFALSKMYASATEIQRPEPWGVIEKNYFLFWDLEGRTYAHHNIYPERVFAQLDIDGSVGPDLAPASAFEDQICISKYMPRISDPELEFIHQATNSLSVTLCKRDAGCFPDESNTFALHIFHYKNYYGYHAVYEPYVMLIRQTAPFALHAISQRPLWISGRSRLTGDSLSAEFRGRPADEIPDGHSEMFYVTSVSWKGHAQRYHGYLDDVVFLAFGIEDTHSGVIDVKVADLLQDLAYC